MNLLRFFFRKTSSETNYTENEKWLAYTLDVPLDQISINRYYIDNGFWYCHYRFHLETRTIDDEISDMNAHWNTERLRAATDDEIHQYTLRYTQ